MMLGILHAIAHFLQLTTSYKAFLCIFLQPSYYYLTIAYAHFYIITAYLLTQVNNYKISNVVIMISILLYYRSNWLDQYLSVIKFNYICTISSYAIIESKEVKKEEKHRLLAKLF